MKQNHSLPQFGRCRHFHRVSSWCVCGQTPDHGTSCHSTDTTICLWPTPGCWLWWNSPLLCGYVWNKIRAITLVCQITHFSHRLLFVHFFSPPPALLLPYSRYRRITLPFIRHLCSTFTSLKPLGKSNLLRDPDASTKATNVFWNYYSNYNFNHFSPTLIWFKFSSGEDYKLDYRKGSTL